MKAIPGKSIPLAHIGKACYISDAFDPPAVTPDSPALSVLTDFSRFPPATTTTSASVSQANHAMIRRGVRSLLVTDDAEHLAGMITAHDVHGERLRQIAKEHGVSAHKVTVGLAMTRVNVLLAATIEDIERATVGDILTTLRVTELQHLLVIEADAVGQPVVRGLFSTTQIARQLGEPTAALFEAPVTLGSFAEQAIDTAVSHGSVPTETAMLATSAMASAEPDSDSSAELVAALECAATGDWDGAHSRAQEAGGRHARLVHGYLHRVDGNLVNARNWYERGGESLPENSLSEEWTRLMELVSAGRL